MNRSARVAMALLFASPATAADAWTATGPSRDGAASFLVCAFGKADYPMHAAELARRAFEKMSDSIQTGGHPGIPAGSRIGCEGRHRVVEGGYRDVGTCTRIDQDGDMWRVQYETGKDLSGSWTTIAGSGKFERLRARGTYRAAAIAPGMAAGGFKSCRLVTAVFATD